ncbi:MAG: NUDIX domain-containing protein [Burkholderiales bacterium]|nr:NUDIX domain-containing protein [Phycisphaerae bacterium]
MKTERSAGFIIFRNSSAGERLFLLLDYGSHWDYPKGHVEAGEDDLTAARRELVEESGITQVKLVPGFAQEISYIFRGRRGGLIQKSVVFFLAEVESDQITLSHEHVGFAWLNAQTASRRVSYANARSVLTAAIKHLDDGGPNLFDSPI